MAPKASSLCTISLLLPILCFSPFSLASFPNSVVIDSESLCNNTQHPEFCKFVLPSNNNNSNLSTTTVFDYGMILVHRSLSNANSFLASVKNLLRRSAAANSSSSPITILALQDCQFLAERNVDFLSYASEKISTNSEAADDDDHLHALLSAVSTNIQTCFDSLEEAAPSDPTIKEALLPSISNGTKLNSISLAVFKHGMISQSLTEETTSLSKNINSNHIFSSNYNLINASSNFALPLRMSSDDEAKYESAIGFRSMKNFQPNDDDDDGVLISRLVVVKPDGSGDFTTINDAVTAAPNNTRKNDDHEHHAKHRRKVKYFLIYVAAGVYEEYVSIPSYKQNLMMIGAGINRTVITGNHSAGDKIYTTFNSSTFTVVGNGFVAVNITFRNTAGPIKQQAVAVRNGADMSAFYRCSFEGYQDTLYTHSLRQFYRECDIYGTVDFIFGNAAVVFQNCNIYPRLPLPKQYNTITAQGRTDSNQSTGISIQNCVIRAADDLASSDGHTKTYLGRPWKNCSRTVVMQSYMDNLIEPSGWKEFSGENFTLGNLVYYAEYKNVGPGSNTDYRVTWPGYHKDIDEYVAANFSVSNFLEGGGKWLPTTGVPVHQTLF